MKVDLFNPTEIPKVSADDAEYSVDVCTIDEDNIHCVGFYHYTDKKWYFHTDTLSDYNETKWKWYYPVVTNADL